MFAAEIVLFPNKPTAYIRFLVASKLLDILHTTVLVSYVTKRWNAADVLLYFL
jgi:hypothetical protein